MYGRPGRSTKYTLKKRVYANYPALTMRWGGLALFLFLIFHLMHLTWGVTLVNPGFERGDAYHNLLSGLSFWPSSLIYIGAVTALGMHLYHGAWSMFQTLGLSDENTSKPLHLFSIGLAVVITVGYLTVPFAILAGIIHE
jgi:succinate dehydrogenase / fumarate reductase, cytochrome b subunit